MADPVNGGTLLGAVGAALVIMLPRVIDRVLGRKGEEADAAEAVGAGAGAVTSAALALLERMQQDRDECRAELAAVNARIDALRGIEAD